MAKIINKDNHLEKELNNYKKNYRISMLFLIVSIILSFLGGILSSIVSFISFIFVIKNRKKIKILKAGLEGEVKAGMTFSKLSDDYYVLSDLDVRVNDKVSQIDSIVVGSNGIFIIETKNLNGVIDGCEEDKEIIQYKKGNKGGEYKKKFYNPIKQVSTHVYRVSEVLKMNKLNKWVQGMVYFTNDKCIVNIDSDRIPVFAASEEGDKEILNYIVNYDNNSEVISKEEKIKIVNILREFCEDANNTDRGRTIF